jgi:hypothetical protein
MVVKVAPALLLQIRLTLHFLQAARGPGKGKDFIVVLLQQESIVVVVVLGCRVSV